MGYLILFAIFFIFSLYSLLNNIALINIGVNAMIINWTILILSFLGMIKAIFHTYIF